MGLVVGEDEGAEGAAGGDQRQEGPGGLAVMGGGGVGAFEVGEGGEETGDTGSHDMCCRGAGDQRYRVEAVHDVGCVAAVADDAQPAFVHGRQGERLGADGGHELAGDLRDHLVDPGGLGEGGRQLRQGVDAYDLVRLRGGAGCSHGAAVGACPVVAGEVWTLMP